MKTTKPVGKIPLAARRLRCVDIDPLPARAFLPKPKVTYARLNHLHHLGRLERRSSRPWWTGGSRSTTTASTRTSYPTRFGT